MKYYRFESVKREIGEILDHSRIWVELEPTSEYLPGTSVLCDWAMGNAEQYIKAGLVHVYEVEGDAVDFCCEDEGEVLLENCTIVKEHQVRRS